MAKKRAKTQQTYWVPMNWTYHGGAFVQAESPDAAVAKAKAGTFGSSVHLHEGGGGASLVDWEVTGKAELTREEWDDYENAREVVS